MNQIIYVPAKSAEDWKRLLKKPEEQWKDGYSAKTLAYCWQNADGFPGEISNALNQSDVELLKNCVLLFAFPEYVVPLAGTGEGSHNDLLVIANSGNEILAITIEGKKDEAFGDQIKIWLKSDDENIDKTNKKIRLNDIVSQLGLIDAQIDEIRYQLLHRTASAIIMAKKLNAKHAIMIVHSFSKNNTNFDDFEKFVRLYNIKQEITINTIYHVKELKDGINLYLGWVQGNTE